MATNDYICLTCGRHYVTVEQCVGTAEDTKCPHCAGANVMKLNLGNIFGFSGGG